MVKIPSPFGKQYPKRGWHAVKIIELFNRSISQQDYFLSMEPFYKMQFDSNAFGSVNSRSKLFN